ncbi:MAG: hypothetical protein K1X53_16295 [Candidatus Sumerlaeaceae bacterium]|nr:hypothetical protein [Candidatus Sumerlaeaceae bacterium]
MRPDLDPASSYPRRCFQLLPVPIGLLRLAVFPLLILIMFLTAGAQAADSLTTATAEVTSGTAAAKGAIQLPPVTGEQILRASLILILFIIIATSIAIRKIPAMVALPLMALGIGLAAGVDIWGKDGILSTILEGRTDVKPTGAFLLYKPIIYTLLGGMFARFIGDSRIAERIIKYAAEFGGENPFFMALIMSVITALIFTTIGGLPAIIMLGTVMFPVLMSLGVPPATCGGLLLMAFPIGSYLSPAGWATRATSYEIPIETVSRFSLIWAGVMGATLLLFLSVEFLRMKRSTVTAASIVKSILGILGLTAVLAFIGYLEPLVRLILRDDSAFQSVKPVLDKIASGREMGWKSLCFLSGALLVLGVLQTQWQYWTRGKVTTQWNLITPILPLILILMLGFDNAYGPAFMASLAYGVLTTPRDRAVQRLGKSIMDGVADVAAPVILMLGIGMLVAAATHPKVEGVLTPILAPIIPRSAFYYVIFFLLASPLALYRGPLNEFGLGFGVARLLSNFMPKAATMGALQAVGMLLDPTTTQNVWVCGYLKLDINSLLFKLFFYSLGLVLIGLILSAYMFFP